MKKIVKLSAALAIAAFAGTASAQISNSIYFDKYNYRQHHLNPAMMPDQRFYFSVMGNFAMDFGNKSISFSDVVKNVNGKSVLFLDKSINGTDEKKGQKDFLDALGKKLHLFANTYIDILDFGFRLGDKSFLGFSVGAKVGTNTMIPKPIFETILGGMKKDETFNLDAGSLYFDLYGYAEAGVTFAHQFGEKLNLGVTGKYLWGGANIKTNFDDIKITGSMEEWTMKGNAEIMASFPGLVAYEKNGKLKIENDLDDDGNEITWRDFKGNKGFALDLGGTYKLFDQLTLAASIKDLGFIRFTKNVAKIHMKKDFQYNGAEFKQDDKRDENGARESGELDFKKYEDEFEETFTTSDDNKFAQALNTKIYLGASWEPIKIIGFGFLSKTTFAHKKVWQEFSASANFHPIRLISINGMYSMMDGSWHALGLGVNLNLGPLNIFTACDNIPVHYGKIKDDNIIFPDKLTSTRINFGLGLVIGSKEHQAKRRAKKEAKEKDDSILNDAWLTPEPDFFDADGDGIADNQDHCPNTEAGAEVDANGCPLDTDEDGVPDYMDKCPGTPIGTSVDENGCALDADGDGVMDDNDRCPGTPQGVTVDSQGCPLDTDGDGVPDYLDKCGETPSSAKVDDKGCPLDTDGDGIPDHLDQCPEIAGVASNNGCPEIKQETKQLFKKALNGIQFETGKSKILKSSYSILNDIAKTMQDNPEYKLYIKGHTDNVGDAQLNLKLSQERADEVLKYLKDKGVEADRMHSEGFGDTRPVAPNNSNANRAKNRRVEFEVEF
ncbi:MAG: OmpA family protein [Bacteroidales bacterium]|nr:OmpA family protein [Bacteroidales bacterium]